MSENIHLLEKEIHSSHSIILFSNNHYANRIGALPSEYPLSECFHAYSKVIRELNKKYNQFNLSSKIASSVDAGFKPTDLTNFMSSLGAGGATDVILTESSDTLVQENGFNLILQQDI